MKKKFSPKEEKEDVGTIIEDFGEMMSSGIFLFSRTQDKEICFIVYILIFLSGVVSSLVILGRDPWDWLSWMSCFFITIGGFVFFPLLLLSVLLVIALTLCIAERSEKLSLSRFLFFCGLFFFKLAFIFICPFKAVLSKN